jgi:hypothetical protein
MLPIPVLLMTRGVPGSACAFCRQFDSNCRQQMVGRVRFGHRLRYRMSASPRASLSEPSHGS